MAWLTLLMTALAVAGPSAATCRAAARDVDARYQQGEVQEAWEAAEAAGADCAPLELKALRRTNTLWEQSNNEERSPPERVELAERETLVTLSMLGPGHADFASSLNNLGWLRHFAGDYDGAVVLLRRALAVRESLYGDAHADTAASLNNLAFLIAERGDFRTALPMFEQAQAITESLLGPSHPDTASGLANVGVALQTLGEYDRALAVLERALAIRIEALPAQHPQVAENLANLALVAEGVGALDVALDYNRRALAMREAVHGPVHPATAESAGNLASLMQRMGAFAESKELFERALSIRESVFGPDHPRTALSLNNLGVLLREQGDHAGSLPLFERALTIFEASLGPDHGLSASALHNVAGGYRAAGQPERAIPLFEGAIAALNQHHGPHHAKTAMMRRNLAVAQLEAGDPEAADATMNLALQTAWTTKDVHTRWSVLRTAMGLAATLGRSGEAALWGKLAVQTVEEARASTTELDATLQASFVARQEPLYRELAGVLVDAGRLGEAEEILELLKGEEHHAFTRGGTTGSPTVSFTPGERAAQERLAHDHQRVVADAAEYRALRTAKLSGTWAPDQQQRLDELTTLREVARATVDQVLAQLRTEMISEGPDRTADWTRLGTERTKRIQGQLRRAGPGVVLVHVVAQESRVLLMVTTPDAQVAEWSAMSRTDLRRAVLAFREAVASPTADPVPAARVLYDAILLPIEPHLTQARAERLLMYLDGLLRYVPIAALHDGEHYVVERWASSVYTPAAEGDLGTPAVASPEVAAFGMSQAAAIGRDRFHALEAVPAELDAVVIDGADDEGAVAGTSYLDGAFTKSSLADQLELGVPWVHLASHFQFRPGTESDSYLVMGDGQPLTVRELRQGDYLLEGVDLLVLSACDTAVGGSGTGAEVEGLAVVAQRLGAKAVVASLWPVDDRSTGAWMADLYRRQIRDGAGHSDAVRATQLAFLHGQMTRDGSGPTRGVARATPMDDPSASWSHPYYWAPFVLFGAATSAP